MRRTFRRSSRTSFPAFIASSPRRGVRRGFRPGLIPLEDRTLLATMIWTNVAGGDWDTAGNWVNSANPSDQHVPTASDDAVINLPNITVTHDTSASDAVDSLVCAAGLEISNGTLTIDTTSPSQPSSTVSGQFTMPGGTLQLLSGTLNLAGGGTIGGTITGAAGTVLGLSGQDLTTSSVISSGGSVQLNSSIDAGSFSAAGGTFAESASFTGTVVSLGGSLEVAGTVSFAPAVGGPVTLTTDSLTLDNNPGSPRADLAGTDSFAVNGPFSAALSTTISTAGAVDAYGPATLAGANRIFGTTLNLYGATTWNIVAPNQFLGDAAVVNILPTATVSLVGDAFATTIRTFPNGQPEPPNH